MQMLFGERLNTRLFASSIPAKQPTHPIAKMLPEQTQISYAYPPLTAYSCNTRFIIPSIEIKYFYSVPCISIYTCIRGAIMYREECTRYDVNNVCV